VEGVATKKTEPVCRKTEEAQRNRKKRGGGDPSRGKRPKRTASWRRPKIAFYCPGATWPKKKGMRKKGEILSEIGSRSREKKWKAGTNKKTPQGGLAANKGRGEKDNRTKCGNQD